MSRNESQADYLVRTEAAEIRHQNMLDDADDAKAADAEHATAKLRRIGRSLLESGDAEYSTGERRTQTASIVWRPNRFGIGVKITDKHIGSVDFTVESLDQV